MIDLSTSGPPSPASVDMPAPTMPRVMRSGARVAAVVAAAIAVITLFGWISGYQLYASIFPGVISMNPMTAVCFLLISLALWLAAPSRRQANFPERVAAAVLSVAVMVVGLLVIAAYFGFLSWHIDLLMFRVRASHNQMAPNTAINFMLMGWSMILSTWERHGRWRFSPLPALLASSLAMLAIIGYVYGVETFYRFHGYVSMAVNTAIAFLVLAIGVLLTRPDREPVRTFLSDTIGGTTARRLIPAAFVIPLLIGWIRLMGEKAGLFTPAFGVSLFTLAISAVFVALIWWNTRFLHRLDLRRRDSEQELREAEAVYQSLVETIPQNIFRKDIDGRFTFGNRNFLTTLSSTLEEVRGKTDFDFYAPELARRYRDDDISVIAADIPTDKIEEHINADGSRLFVEVIKTPVRDRDGRVIGVQGIYWDVTFRKLAEEELERKNLQLEEANTLLKTSMTSEVHAHEGSRKAHEALSKAHEALKTAQTQLVQTEKLAGLGQMVAGVAHEINNPLSFVSNNVAVLQRDAKALVELLTLYRKADPTLAERCPDLAGQIRDLAENIDLSYTIDNLQELLVRSRDGLKRIQQIVKDLRDFARLDESDLNEVDINAGIESTLNIIFGHAKKKRVTLEKQLSPLPRVACYPAKVNQVVMNLLANAIDASEEGGSVTVRTSTAEMMLGEGTAMPVVRIDVVDRGSGIPPHIRQRIFDPFFTTKPQGQGTGLGLSISYGIIRDHGGRIEVDSTPGEGSTFSVILPVKEKKSAEG